MQNLELTIRKIRHCEKWLEFWIDGLPYENVDQWNYTCKWYEFEKIFKKSYPKKSFNEIFNQKGLNGFIGYKIIGDINRRNFKIKAPINSNDSVLLQKICEQVQLRYGMIGLSTDGSLYSDFAKDVAIEFYKTKL